MYMGDYEEFYKKNKGIIHSVVRKHIKFHKNGAFGYDDLVQEGRIAMWKALRNFQENKGTKVTSYCYVIIRNHLLNYVKSQYSGFQREWNFLSLDYKMNEDENDDTFLDTFGDERVPFYFNEVETEDWVDNAFGIMGTNDRYRDVFKRFIFGLETYEDIGKSIGVSKQRVYSMIKNAKRDLMEVFEYEENLRSS